jgi:hypothetical protein
MRSAMLRSARQLIAVVAMVLSFGLIGWGGQCTSNTDYRPKAVPLNPPLSCQGRECQQVVGGGCFSPLITTNTYCNPTSETISYTTCSGGDPNTCTPSTTNVTATSANRIPCC